MTVSVNPREDVPEGWPDGIDCHIDFHRLASFQRLKRGGFAMVYRARLDGRDVAVKVLHREEVTPSKLFIQEAAVLRMLRHRWDLQIPEFGMVQACAPSGSESWPRRVHMQDSLGQ